MLKLDLQPNRRILAQFAWFALFGLPLIAGFVLRLTGTFSWSHPAFLAVAGLGVLQLGLFLVATPALTRALFIGLSVIAMPIGFVLSHVLLMFVYYLVITPIALVFRVAGRDVIGRRPDPNRTSYWHDRKAVRPATSYFKLF